MKLENKDYGLHQVAIGIKTFLRDELLINAIRAIRETMPEVQLIIADDGRSSMQKAITYCQLMNGGHEVIMLPFDSGFGAKSNVIAKACERPYLLIGSDDFDFRYARSGIERLYQTLNSNPHIAIASGRVNTRKYEFDLQDLGDTIVETPVDDSGTNPLLTVDLTVNYSLIRKEVFQKVSWDNDVKIGGGEHGAFFIDCMRAGFQTAWVRGVNIDEQPMPALHAEYMKYRRRALSPDRPCFEKRGIKKYILGNGQVDYVSPDSN